MRAWALLPGANERRAVFSWGDGLIEAEVDCDGNISFGGPWPKLTREGDVDFAVVFSALDTLDGAIWDYWHTVPSSGLYAEWAAAGRIAA